MPLLLDDMAFCWETSAIAVAGLLRTFHYVDLSRISKLKTTDVARCNAFGKFRTGSRLSLSARSFTPAPPLNPNPCGYDRSGVGLIQGAANRPSFVFRLRNEVVQIAHRIVSSIAVASLLRTFGYQGVGGSASSQGFTVRLDSRRSPCTPSSTQ
jgi:hypothetical protein